MSGGIVMNLINKSLKNANIVIVADKLYSSFLSSNFFPFLPASEKMVQIPPFGLLDFGNYNFIVDVDNRRVTINDLTGNIAESHLPQMARHFLSNVPGPDIKGAGFNYMVELTFDEEFGKYSTEKFISSNIKSISDNDIVGAGIKIFIRKEKYLITLEMQPVLGRSSSAIVNANFHYGILIDIDWEKDFSARYHDVERYINGIFS